MKLSSLLSNS